MKQIIILFIASSLLVFVGALLKLQQVGFVANSLMIVGIATSVAFWYVLIRFLYLNFVKKSK